MPEDPTIPIDTSLERAPFRLVIFWKEDPRVKKTFLQYREVQVRIPSQPANVLEGEVIADEAYEFYPLVLSRRLEALILQWRDIDTIPEALAAQKAAITDSEALFAEAMEASDNPHCEIFVAQTALNFLTTVDLLFNIIYYADELPLFFPQDIVAKTQQSGALYLWLDPYLAGITQRRHKPLDTDEALWPAKEEVYCYFKRKTDPTVSPQQLANVWRTTASRIVEIDEECRQKLWGWLKGQSFSEEEIRGLILP